MAGKILQGVSSFLGHSSSTSSGGFLDSWKDDGEIDIVLHPEAPIAAVWLHRWYRIDNDKEGKPKIFPNRFNSMEDEKLLKKQHFRHNDGTREYPPKLCPFSLLLEWVREAVEENDIDWRDEIFRFETPRETTKILAGGFTGLFQSDKLEDEQLKELSDAGIARNLAFKQNARCSLSYVFCVVNYAAPEEGCVIAMEGKALGDKMKKAIRDETRKWEKSATPSKGDPFASPYVFRWTYDEKQNFDDKFDVVAMPAEAMPIPPDVQEVLDDDPPDIEKLIEPSNVALLRASFEEHWVHKIVPPWDDLFAKAEAAVKGTPAGEEPTSFNHGASAKAPAAPPKAERRTNAPDKPAPVVAPLPAEDEKFEYECDKCHAGMHGDWRECKKCGAKYDDDGNLLPDPPPPPKEEPKRRSRSAAAAESKSASEPAPAAATAPPPVAAEAPRRRRGG